MRRPVNSPYSITTEFGEKDSYALFGYHSGVDYAVPLNRPVYAPISGTLTNVVSSTGGNMVVIFDGQFYHRLMHNNSFSRANGRVNEGDEAAKAGTTGLSTGVHCHWDININGNVARSFADFRDPAKWLNGDYKAAPTAQGGTMVTDRAQLDRLYLAVVRRDRQGQGEDVYLGKDSGWVFDDLYKSGERATRIGAEAKLISDLQTALANEQAKPPKEVVRTVTEIVEKVVEKQVLVETEPSWLVKVRDFINGFLKKG